MNERFFSDPESLLGALARLFASDGAAREVAILAHAMPEIVESDYDNLDGGQTYYTLFLNIPLPLYSQVEKDEEDIGNKICERLQILLSRHEHDHVTKVSVVPAVVDDPQWREKARVWLSGQKINNQGRVRSNNVAPLGVDGLLFRSQPEINLYQALKNMGISFAPLPVFIRGGASYRRIEPDFVLIKNGVIMVVEVDGDTVHNETPAEAHSRTTMLLHEGVHVERVRASECDTLAKAKICADKLVSVIERIRAAR